MDQLRSSVLDKNTVVILTSDHGIAIKDIWKTFLHYIVFNPVDIFHVGWSLGEHAEWAKYSNFEVALRVPLIVSIPRTGPQVEITNVGRSGFLCPNPKKINKSKAKRQTIRRLVESSVESIEPVTESGYRGKNLRLYIGLVTATNCKKFIKSLLVMSIIILYLMT